MAFDAHNPLFTVLVTDMSWNTCMEFIAVGDAVSSVKSMQKILLTGEIILHGRSLSLII